MALIIAYPSAMKYWLYEEGVPYAIQRNAFIEPVSTREIENESFAKKDMVELAELLDFELPLHVLLPMGHRRMNDYMFRFHCWPRRLPPNSIVRISDSLYIESPELCFVHAAKEMKLHQAVHLANELCAIYIKDPEAEYGQRKREILTTTETISDFLKQADGLSGVNPAKHAITYALNRSNSPMESKLATLAMVPNASGGYALLKPDLNLDVTLLADGALHLGRETCCCDMVWEEQKVVLEYDSNLSHLDVQQHFKDKKRLTALTLSNYKVISVTAEQVRNFSNIENLFLQLRHVLGLRTSKERWERYFDKRWEVVRDVMFSQKSPVESSVDSREWFY